MKSMLPMYCCEFLVLNEWLWHIQQIFLPYTTIVWSFNMSFSFMRFSGTPKENPFVDSISFLENAETYGRLKAKPIARPMNNVIPGSFSRFSIIYIYESIWRSGDFWSAWKKYCQHSIFPHSYFPLVSMFPFEDLSSDFKKNSGSVIDIVFRLGPKDYWTMPLWNFLNLLVFEAFGFEFQEERMFSQHVLLHWNEHVLQIANSPSHAVAFLLFSFAIIHSIPQKIIHLWWKKQLLEILEACKLCRD